MEFLTKSFQKATHWMSNSHQMIRNQYQTKDFQPISQHVSTFLYCNSKIQKCIFPILFLGCGCNPNGTLVSNCTSDERCICKNEFTGPGCDKCKPGFYGEPEYCYRNIIGNFVKQNLQNIYFLFQLVIVTPKVLMIRMVRCVIK